MNRFGDDEYNDKSSIYYEDNDDIESREFNEENELSNKIEDEIYEHDTVWEIRKDMVEFCVQNGYPICEFLDMGSVYTFVKSFRAISKK